MMERNYLNEFVNKGIDEELRTRNLQFIQMIQAEIDRIAKETKTAKEFYSKISALITQFKENYFWRV